MGKNNNNRSSDFCKESFRIINRKRSQRWVSDETKLLKKYGLRSRYLNKYVL